VSNIELDARAILAEVPNLPGVYRFANAAGEVIYVGKARDLKKRVASYFQKTAQSPRTAVMVAQIAGVETTVTRTEWEALILENNLIKSLNPRYNIMFRDDKSYPYIMVSGHEYPQIRFYRGSFDKAHDYYGPYATAWAVRETIGVLQKVFRLRTCEDTVFANRSRPCLLHQIRRCSAPCVGAIDSVAYARDIGNAKLFLAGKPEEVLAGLQTQMHAAAQQLEFEQAALYRDQIQSLQRVITKQYVVSESERDADVVAVHQDERGALCVNLVMVRGGRHLGDKSFFPSNAEGAGLDEVVEAFLMHHYADKQSPRVIICNVELGEKENDAGEALAAALSQRADANSEGRFASSGARVQITSRVSGEARNWLDMALQNAKLALSQRRTSEGAQAQRLDALRAALNLPAEAQRIECFDISHTMGEATVAACVVYDQGKMQSSQYRRYNMREVTPGDDYGAMREVLARRYSKVAAGEGAMPDLVLIDGGKGQVNAAAEVLNELGLSGVALVGVAKGEARKPGLEQLVFAEREETLRLPADHPGLHLIQQVRDEAHRFAITGHRARRAKARVKSSLEDITGIGAKRRQKLLTHFGGLRGVLSASADDLAMVEGISRELAQSIYRQLH
jgi:excinuclease ABC subunit C